MVLFTLVDLQSQCMWQVCEPVNICLGKVLKKSLNWWITKSGGTLVQARGETSWGETSWYQFTNAEQHQSVANSRTPANLDLWD